MTDDKGRLGCSYECAYKLGHITRELFIEYGHRKPARINHDPTAILPPVSAEDEATVDALLAKAREGVGKRPIGGRPDLDAIRARCEAAQVIFARNSVVAPCVYDDIPALLAYVEELERDLCRMHSDIVEISEAADKDDIPRTIARAALRDWRARMEEINAT